jgi:hypothetical protein
MTLRDRALTDTLPLIIPLERGAAVIPVHVQPDGSLRFTYLRGTVGTYRLAEACGQLVMVRQG